jgi:aspartyl-tRNA(Asn)/glutamyl-tRNA(Gln) amidotransferase subunit A
MTEIADLTACDLAAAIRDKTVSPVEAVEAVLARMEARRDLNAFLAARRSRSRRSQASGSLSAAQ